jgi:hypothetical protein
VIRVFLVTPRMKSTFTMCTAPIGVGIGVLKSVQADSKGTVGVADKPSKVGGVLKSMQADPKGTVGVGDKPN